MLPECCICACVSSNYNEVINCWRPFSVRFVRKLCGILGLKEESNLISFVTEYSRMDQVDFFKGCLSQILLGPFLNTLTHLFQRFFRFMLFSVVTLNSIIDASFYPGA